MQYDRSSTRSLGRNQNVAMNPEPDSNANMRPLRHFASEYATGSQNFAGSGEKMGPSSPDGPTSSGRSTLRTLGGSDPDPEEDPHHVNDVRLLRHATSPYARSPAGPGNIVFPSFREFRRNAIDSTLIVGTDYWHAGKSQMIVNQNVNRYPGILFFPDIPTSVGVALSRCEYHEGMAYPDKSILGSMPRQFATLHEVVFRIRWLGYEQVNWSTRLALVEGRPRRHIMMHELMSRIAHDIRCFYDAHFNDFNGCGIPLGPHAVTFNNLRVTQLFTTDGGQTWEPELTYVLD